MEYLYIGGIVAYYLYKAYSNHKKKEQENLDTIPPTQHLPKKKKKGFFDEFLEELEKQNNPPAPTYQKANVPTSNRREPVIDKTPKKLNSPKKKPVTIIDEVNKYSFQDYSEGNTATKIGSEPMQEMEAIIHESDQPRKKRGFAGMDMTPKQALKAQIILERKY